MKKRLFAAFVCLCMIVSMLPTMAFAEAGVQDSGIVTSASGLCEHHTEHTADCGYTEGTAEIPCSHEHTEDCYTLVTECVHEHTAECYPAESVSENTATPSEPEEAEPSECTHECSEESGCMTKTLDCKHEHDEACGYVPTTEGTPCTFVCEVCNVQDSGGVSTPSDTQLEECICETLCTEDSINMDCLVCSVDGADLTVCKGTAPAECTCETLCTDEEVNMDCSVCSVEGADLSNCKGEAFMMLSAGGGTITADSDEVAVQNAFGSTDIKVSGNVITLDANVPVDATVTFESGDWTLDLGTYTLSGNTAVTPLAVNGGSLTIRGSSGMVRGGDIVDETGSTNIRGGVGIDVNGGNVTVESGTVRGGDATGNGLSVNSVGISVDKGSVIVAGGTVRGGTISGERDNGVTGITSGIYGFDATIIVTDGSVQGGSVPEDDWILHSEEISSEGNITVAVLGGEVTAENPGYSILGWGNDDENVIVTGGKITDGLERIGTAVITGGVCNADKLSFTNGLWLPDQGDSLVGNFVGDVTLPDLTKVRELLKTVGIDDFNPYVIEADEEITISENQSLTIPAGETLFNYGTSSGEGSIIEEGTLKNNDNGSVSDTINIIRSGSAHTHPVCGSSGSCTDPDHGTEHTDVTWTEWNETTSLPNSGGNYYLTENVTLSKTWEAPSGETSLCLNGHSIAFTNGLTEWDMSGKDIDDTSRSVIKVPNGAKLTVTDCQNNTGTITGGTGTFVKGLYVNTYGGYCGGGIFVDNGGTLNLYGGSIEENHCPMYMDASGDQGGGGGIFVNGGAFHMYGGTITQNSAHYNGNGVFCWGGTFHMYGGSITENGREIPDWRLTYMGSTGGVGISNGADMTMYGGEISANLAYYLGGIRVNGADSSLTLHDDAKIINHTCQKLDFGGVYIQSGADFNMNGGQICDNTEGAVEVQDSTMVMTDGTISAHHTYGTYGIDICDFSGNSNVTISGGTVSGNSSAYKSDITHTNAENSSLTLSGNPSIESISLEPENVITIADALTYNTPITVQKDGGGVFTSGWTEKMQGNEPENYFASWSKDYSLGLSENELNLSTDDTEHIHNGITFDKDLGADANEYYMSFPGITENGNYRLTTDLVFGSENNLFNSLFIANDTSSVTVNLCLNKYNLNRMNGGLSTGPVLVVYTNGTLNLYSDEGGTISGNSTTKDDLTGGLGGGIYTEGGILNIYGGTITGNTADVAGGGIYADKENSVNICGGDTPIIIIGNKVGEKENNLYFADGATMKINVLPAEGSQIGISMETPGLFATVAAGIDPAEVAKFFISDDPAYTVVPTEDGLALGKQQTMPTIAINYQTEMLTGFVNDGSYTMNGKAVTPSADGTIAIQEEWMGTTLSIVRKGDGDTADSNAQNLLIPARPVAPDVTAGIQKINGADASMEYSSDSGATWTAFTDETISRISAGTYLVRYRAKADAFASQSTSEIHVRNSSSGGGGGSSYDYYTITASAGTGGSISPSGNISVREDTDKTFTITPDSGYHISDVLVDGKSVGAVTSYTFEDVQKKHTIEAVFAKDNPDTGVDHPFTDVHLNDWFYEAVMFVYQNNLMNGTSATTFSPNDATTRAQIATIFYRMAGSPAVENTNPFTDVPYGPGTDWYYDAVLWVQQNGIMQGYGDNLFGPGDPVTREQLAVIFYNYAKFKGYDTTASGDLSGFTDAGDLSPWAQEAMKWAVGSGVMSGKGNGILDPKGTATRAEIAAMLQNFIEKNNLVPVVPGGNGGTGGTGSGGGWTQHVPSPQTGDSSNMGLWFSLMMASLASLVVLTVSRRWKNEDEETLPQLI